MSSKMTGMDVILIDQLAIILEALSSGFEIYSKAFGLEAFNTEKLFVKL